MGSNYLYDRDLFGQKIEPPNINVYHDESGAFGCSRWCLTGLIWCREENESGLVDQMMQVREGHKYWGKIHYSELPARFEGTYNVDAKVARDWLNLYIRNLSYRIWFNVIAVDTQHKTYNAANFGHSFHAYNRFTAMALYSGLKWHFSNNSQIKLSLFSDDKIQRPGTSLGDGMKTDNFEEYIIKRLHRDAQADRSCPSITFKSPIRMVNIPKTRRKVDIKNEEELVQLCDLLLGSIYSAITLSSSTEVKRWLGKTIAPLITDTRLEPWKQAFNLHRRFSVSYFPGVKGNISTDGQLAIKDNTTQLRFNL